MDWKTFLALTVCFSFTAFSSEIAPNCAFNELFLNSDQDAQCLTAPKSKNFLVIGITSAQHHFEERQSIRETWLNLVNYSDTEYFFLVGKKFCQIPPEDRIEKESCEEWFIDSSGLDSTSKLSLSIKSMDVAVTKPQYAGFSFLVLHPLILQNLSIIRNAIPKDRSARVSLFDSFSGKRYVSATFSPRRSDDDMEEMVEMSVGPLLLPKGFEGQVILESREEIPMKIVNCSQEWSDANGLVSFLQLIKARHLKPLPFHHHSCPLVSASFTPYDIEGLEAFILGKEERQGSWDHETEQIETKLFEEAKEKQDILLLDTVDVYRNLPDKVLQFFRWVYLNQDFSYVLKTDDDTFINIKEVSEFLKNGILSEFDWWSTFRESWAVQTTGKWREDVYHSASYPPFPCGAGYILNHKMIAFLGNDGFQHLYRGFQGEDAAIGIWLAGLNPRRQDILGCKWVCDNQECSPDHCNRAQLSVKEMYQAWNALQTCGSFCGC